MEHFKELTDRVSDLVSGASRTQLLVGGVATLVSLNWIRKRLSRPKNVCLGGTWFTDTQMPPHVRSPVPWFGNIAAFGEQPINFLLSCYEKVCEFRGC